jgi:hypothetical protein
METESNNTLQSVGNQPIQEDILKSNHLSHVMTGVVCSLTHRASIICQEQHDFHDEIENIKHES